MIVQCPDCASRFRLADDKLKAEGIKVRCSRCKKVFTVMSRKDVLPMIDDVSETCSEDLGRGAGGFHEIDFGDALGSHELSGESALNNDFSVDSDFDFEAFSSDQDFDGLSSVSGDEADSFAFGDPASLEEGSEFSMGEDSDEDFFSSSARGAGETQGLGESSDLPLPTFVELLSSGAQSVCSDEGSGFKDDLFGSMETGVADLGSLPPVPRMPLARKSGRRGWGFLFALCLVALAAGGYFAWKSGNVDLASLIDVNQIRTWLHLGTSEAIDGQIRTVGLNGFYLENRKAGRLFVIQGEAVNDFRGPRSAIAVKGVIFDEKGEPLLQQTVFCGNPLDATEMTKMPFDRIVERMNNQFGDSLSNLNVPAGKVIPFTIVFRNLPPALNTFSVEVVDSKSATR